MGEPPVDPAHVDAGDAIDDAEPDQVVNPGDGKILLATTFCPQAFYHPSPPIDPDRPDFDTLYARDEMKPKEQLVPALRIFQEKYVTAIIWIFRRIPLTRNLSRHVIPPLR